MRDAAALIAALSMTRDPTVSRLATRSPLPSGVTFLLEVAAGETEALAAATNATRRSEAALRDAAGFFIEQVLFNRRSDSYRVLGGTREMPSPELRRHMALLMKWLHPDVSDRTAASGARDRQVFVNRITSAWEDVKTDERRTAYDARQTAGSASASDARSRSGGMMRSGAKKGRSPAKGADATGKQRRAEASGSRHRQASAGLGWHVKAVQPSRASGVLSRLLDLIRGRP